MDMKSASKFQEKIFEIMRGQMPCIVKNKEHVGYFVPDIILTNSERSGLIHLMEAIDAEMKKRAMRP